jgi:hypothetical protein
MSQPQAKRAKQDSTSVGHIKDRDSLVESDDSHDDMVTAGADDESESDSNNEGNPASPHGSASDSGVEVVDKGPPATGKRKRGKKAKTPRVVEEFGQFSGLLIMVPLLILS